MVGEGLDLLEAGEVGGCEGQGGEGGGQGGDDAVLGEVEQPGELDFEAVLGEALLGEVL